VSDTITAPQEDGRGHTRSWQADDGLVASNPNLGVPLDDALDEDDRRLIHREGEWISYPPFSVAKPILALSVTAGLLAGSSARPMIATSWLHVRVGFAAARPEVAMRAASTESFILLVKVRNCTAHALVS
jgi:hypothetical protein